MNLIITISLAIIASAIVLFNALVIAVVVARVKRNKASATLQGKSMAEILSDPKSKALFLKTFG